MPLGKYYCDYCDKQFQDTPGARRRHLQGTAHLRNRKLWYDSLRVAEHHGTPFRQPDGTMSTGVCQHFIRTGICKYGDSCKYVHPKPEIVSTVPVASGEMLSGQVSSWGNLPLSLQPPPEGGRWHITSSCSTCSTFGDVDANASLMGSEVHRKGWQMKHCPSGPSIAMQYPSESSPFFSAGTCTV